MDDELRELYQQMILDHSKNPRNFHAIEGATAEAVGYNQLCGDKVNVFLAVDGEKVSDVSFTGSGCAICMSSASLMTESLKGKTLAQAKALFKAFHEFLTGETDIAEADPMLDRLTVLSGVRVFPMRVKCATLPWHTLQEALGKCGGGSDEATKRRSDEGKK